MMRKLLNTSSSESEEDDGRMSSITLLPISSAVLIIGFLLGVLLATYLMVKYPNCYRKLLRCIKPSAESGDVLVVGDNSSNGRAGTSVDPYTEINENNTFVRHPTTELNAVSFSRRKGYEKCNIVGVQQRYSPLAVPSGHQNGSQSHDSYEPVSVHRGQPNENDNRASGPVYHIIEPGSNKRLPVRPLQHEMLTEYHVYFKLEAGGNKAIQIPRAAVNAYYGSRDFIEEKIYVLATDLISSCEEASPYAVNDISDEPMYYTLEKQV